MYVSRYLPVAAAAAMAIPAVPAAAAEIQIQAQNPVVELTVNEVVKSSPDTAQVGAGVQVRAPTAVEAMRQNAAQMDKVIARLRQLGIKAEDIQTSNFSLNPQYDYRGDGQLPQFLGYDAGNQVSVTLRDMGKIGETLDALVQAGANNVNGPSFSLEKDAAVKAAARKAAFEHARTQATEYARMAGYAGVRVLEISESISQVGPMPVAQAMEMRAGAAKTPIEPGQVGTGVTVTVKFEMTK
jgi:uncharacterized protein YggE